ncbi:TM2 domain-containing protein [Deinococcus altitudinis]|uniref:TM2 domain-containing protein n=1 Tax=Deinococcus altitudinis TaxID=468914 RepID=UPI003892820C
MTDDPSRPESVPSTPSTRPEAVSLDKAAVSGAPSTNQTQEGGSSPWADAQAAAARSAAAGNGGVPLNSSQFSSSFQPQVGAVQSDVAQKKLVAGLLGIFLGSLGVHKFYLGMNQPGVIMLVCTVAGYLLFTLLAIILIGFIFLLLPAAVGLVGLIEGILYLTKSDADFQREYIVGKKAWF